MKTTIALILTVVTLAVPVAAAQAVTQARADQIAYNRIDRPCGDGALWVTNQVHVTTDYVQPRHPGAYDWTGWCQEVAPFKCRTWNYQGSTHKDGTTYNVRRQGPFQPC